MTYITNASAIIFILSTGEKVRVEKTDSKYPKAIKIFELPSEEQEAALVELVRPQAKLVEKGFIITPTSVSYQGEVLPSALVTKVLSIVRDGLPIDHFEKFWENLRENPSAQSVAELVDFLSYKELPITEDGCFLAYKGVLNNYYSATGNTETTVIKGIVDEQGRIYNGIGEEIEVLRRDVDDNRANECSFGLHIGSLDYGSTFSQRTILVKINPKDVVSVPKDYNFQKCRVCKYTVVGDFVEEIKTSVVDANGGDTFEVKVDDTPVVTEEYNETVKKIDRYLTGKKNAGCSQVTIRQVQNSFSPKWITQEVVLDALQKLWYTWEYDDELSSYVIYL